MSDIVNIKVYENTPQGMLAAIADAELRLDQKIDNALLNSTLINAVTTSSSVPPTGNIHAIGVGAGTYPNWGGMVIPSNNIGTLQRVDGVYSVSLTAFEDINKILPWVDGSYAPGDQVNYLGKDWVSNAAPVAGDVPGKSGKWVDRLTSKANKSDINAELSIINISDIEDFDVVFSNLSYLKSSNHFTLLHGLADNSGTATLSNIGLAPNTDYKIVFDGKISNDSVPPVNIWLEVTVGDANVINVFDFEVYQRKTILFNSGTSNSMQLSLMGGAPVILDLKNFAISKVDSTAEKLIDLNNKKGLVDGYVVNPNTIGTADSDKILCIYSNEIQNKIKGKRILKITANVKDLAGSTNRLIVFKEPQVAPGGLGSTSQVDTIFLTATTTGINEWYLDNFYLEEDFYLAFNIIEINLCQDKITSDPNFYELSGTTATIYPYALGIGLFVENGINLEETIANNISEIKIINDKLDTNAEEIVENQIDLVDMNFKVKRIITDSHFMLPIYEDNFENNTNYNTLFDLINLDGSGISYSVSNNQLLFTPSGGTVIGDGAVVKTNFDAKCPNGIIKVKIKDLVNDSILVGLCKDANNYALYKYNPANNQIYRNLKLQGDRIPGDDPVGVVPSWVNPNSNYELWMQSVASYVLLYIKTDDGIFFVGIQGLPVYDGYACYQDFSGWCFSVGVNYSTSPTPIKIDGISIGYGSGASIGADYKVARNINGETYIEDNCIFVTSSQHSTGNIQAGGGINIFKINIDNYKIEFVGLLNFKNGGIIETLQATSIIYDTINKNWIVSGTGFGIHIFGKPLIGITKKNILYGAHIIDMNIVNFGSDLLTWDFDFLYSAAAGKYYGVLKSGDTYETDDYNGLWTKTSDGTAYEGSVLTIVNNKLLYTCGTEDLSLKIVDYFTNTDLGNLEVDKFPRSADTITNGGTPTWGSIISIYRNGVSEYMAILFSLRLRDSTAYYSYGDMWIYKAEEVNVGKEVLI